MVVSVTTALVVKATSHDQAFATLLDADRQVAELRLLVAGRIKDESAGGARSAGVDVGIASVKVQECVGWTEGVGWAEGVRELEL